MRCTLNNLNLSFDKDNRIKEVIVNICGANQRKQTILASFLSTGEFVEYLKNNITINDIIKEEQNNIDLDNITAKDYYKLNKNVLRKLLANYYNSKYKSVTNSVVIGNLSTADGFTSIDAKTVAKRYTATLILDEYYTELSVPEEVRRKPLEIIKEVNTKLRHELYNKIHDFVQAHLNENTESNLYSKCKKYKDVLDLINQWEQLVKESNIIKQEARKNNLNYDKRIEPLTKRLKELKAECKELTGFDNLYEAKFLLIVPIVNNIPNNMQEKESLTNFLNLVNKTRENTDNWYFQVFHSKLMTSAANAFNNIGSIEEYLEHNEEGDVEYKDESIDEMTKTWESSLYKSFDSTISNKLKIILSTIPVLTQPFNKNDIVQSVDINNPLGVRTYMDAMFLTTQIYAFGNFSSVDTMIQSLRNKFNSIPELYGAGKLIDMMEKRRDFANFMFSNFAKPIVSKIMLNIADSNQKESVSTIISNKDINPLASMVFKCANTVNVTYDIAYNENLLNPIKELFKEYNKNIKNNKSVEELKNLIINELYNVFHNYFPNVEKTSFINIFTRTTDFEKIASAIKENLDIINKAAGKRKKTILDRQIKVYEENAKINKDYLEAKKEFDAAKSENLKADIQLPIKEEYKTVDYSYTWERSFNAAIIDLSKYLINYSPAYIRLNSTNAEGNSNANVLKNSHVSRIFEQLHDETNITRLIEFYQQGIDGENSNQYVNNPILFGIKDVNGIIIRPGLFNIENGQVVRNPNINPKDFLQYHLFDGVRNKINSSGVGYEKLSKVDFFTTQYSAFWSSVETLGNHGVSTTLEDGHTNTALYAMKTPSDAPKTFFIRAPRYNSSELVNAFYGHLMNELNLLCKGLDNIFEFDGTNYNLRKDVKNLNPRLFYNEKAKPKVNEDGSLDYTEAIIKDGKLTGKIFSISRLFPVEYNGTKVNVGEEVMKILSLYGGGNEGILIHDNSTKTLSFNKNHSVFKLNANGKIYIDLDADTKQYIFDLVSNWCDVFANEAESYASSMFNVLEELGYGPEVGFKDFILNTTNMNFVFDDLFEGDYKYYKDTRDVLKRSKQVQAGGNAYAGYDLSSTNHNELIELQTNNTFEYIQFDSNKEFNQETKEPVRKNIHVNGRDLIARNGFRAVTIRNTLATSDYVDVLYTNLKNNFIQEGYDENTAHNKALTIAKKYGDVHKEVLNNAEEDITGGKTKINDAQSYITFEEFIRRRWAEGNLSEYADLIELINSDKEISDIDFEKITAKIQIQKNFYYDIIYDKDTGIFRPRQIKNAEFVLIPKLLPENSDLRKLHDWMVKHDIGQVNTEETSKASNKNILTIFDEVTGELHDENLVDDINDYVENYFYSNLYKQLDVPQHVVNATNKAGSQIMKKILDNIYSELGVVDEQLKKAADEFQEAYTTNIEESFTLFLDNMGWEYDKNSGHIINKDYPVIDAQGNPLSKDEINAFKHDLNFENFFSKARQEAARSGMDANFIEYLIPNEFGRPNLPMHISVYAQKLEAVAQSVYNRTITRQTLPGWHGAQLTDVGYSDKLQFDAENGIMEIYLPRWSNLIPKGKTPEEDTAILKQIAEEGLDIHLGYRMPTEGKQSISILRIKGFVHEALGSTVVVPREWVIQTGSDFDVDSIYGISWEMYKKIDRKGKISLYKIPYEESHENSKLVVDDKQLYIQYVRTRIAAQIKTNEFGKELTEDKITIKKENGQLIKATKKELKDEFFKSVKENSEHYDELDEKRNEAYTSLNKAAKFIIQDINKKYITTKKENGKIIKTVDIKLAYPEINDKLTEYINTHEKLTEEEKINIETYIDIQNGIIELMKIQEGISFNKEHLSESIKTILEEGTNKLIAKAEEFADMFGLMNFTDFSKQPHIKKLSRAARNNFILDRMIQIMKNPKSKEEQYTGSHFEDISNANRLIDDLWGKTSKTTSPHNPMDQLDSFEDATAGMAMKAKSVNWDTFNSKNNIIQSELDDASTIEVVIDESYDIEAIKRSYGAENVYEKEINQETNQETNIKKIVNDELTQLVLNTLENASGFEKFVTIDEQTLIDIVTKNLININAEVTSDNIQYVLDIRNEIINSNVSYENIVPLINYSTAKSIGLSNNIIYGLEPIRQLLLEEDDNKTAVLRYSVFKNYEELITRGTDILDDAEYNKAKKGYEITNNQLIAINKLIELCGDITDIGKLNDLGRVLSNNYPIIPNIKNKKLVNLLLNTQSPNNQTTKTKKQIIVKFNKLGFSNDGHNLVGKLVTAYTSQTTAHHLDAIKVGSVDNVNTYTFGVYKLLSSIGIDYETVIGFMRQPVIYALVRNHNALKSIYTKDSANAITKTMIELANNLGIKDRGKSISEHTSRNNLINLLKSNPKVKQYFNDIWGIDITTQSFEDIKVPLNRKELFERIKNHNESSDYNKIFDLGILLTFSNIAKTAQVIDNIMLCTTPDTVGANPELREARNIIDKVEEIRKNKTLNKNGVSFVDLIFPTVNGRWDVIDIKKSLYPPVAAMYQYSVINAYKTNSNLFITEDEDFAKLEEFICSKIGRKFNKKEYKVFKKYCATYMYHRIEKLNTPLTLNHRGQVIVNERLLEEQKLEQKTANKYWLAEQARITGYNRGRVKLINIEDINNVSEDEFYEFSKLTPAEKVLNIQKLFEDNCGIFKYLNVTLLNNADLKRRGYTRQYISYDDLTYSVDEMIHLFNQSFFNRNRLIKLACIDLIKYGFIAEGFDYKAGYISKIISNKALYDSFENSGLDLSYDINDQVNNIVNDIITNDEDNDSFVELFVRSHSELIDEHRFTQPLTYLNETAKIISNIKTNGIIILDDYAGDILAHNIVSKLNLQNRTYVRLNINTKTKDGEVYSINGLYKAVVSDKTYSVLEKLSDGTTKNTLVEGKFYSLSPLNILDANEVNTISYNKNNNLYPSIEDYNILHTQYWKNPNALLNVISPVEGYNGATMFDSATDEENFLIDILESNNEGDRYLKGKINQLVKDIQEYMDTTKNYTIDKAIVLISDLDIVENNQTKYYNLPVKDKFNNVVKKRYLLKRVNGKSLNNSFKKQMITDVAEAKTKRIVHTSSNNWLAVRHCVITESNPVFANYFAIKEEPLMTAEEYNANTELIRDDNSVIENISLASEIPVIHSVANSIYKEINNYKRKYDNESAQQFLHTMRRVKLNPDSIESFKEHTEDIYKAAARYYATAASAINKKLKEFELGEGVDVQKYNLNDDEFYEALIENPQQFPEVSQLILEGLTFGKKFSEIFNIDLSVEDINTKEAIESIKRSIESVRNNKTLSIALDKLINIYFKQYSSNPLIVNDILKLRETYGDIDKLDYWIASAADIPNNEVQVFLKKVYSIFSEAEMFETKKNVKEWQDRLKEIDEMKESLDINKIIDLDSFKLRQEFNEDWIKDKSKIISNFNEKSALKYTSDEAYKDYIKAYIERERFLTKYTEREIISDYYEERFKLLEEVYNKAGDVYIKYKQLTDQLYNSDISGMNAEDIANEKAKINAKISALRSLVTESNEKSVEEQQKIKALEKYLKENKKLSEKYFDSQEYEGFQETYKRYKFIIDEYNQQHPEETLELKLQNENYKEAYDWIRSNGRLGYTKEENDKLQHAFEVLSGSKKLISSSIMSNLRKRDGLVDECGIIDATKLTEQDIEAFKKLQESEFDKYYDSNYGDSVLIKFVPKNIPSIKFNINGKNNHPIVKQIDFENKAEKLNTISKINSIISKAIDRNTGNIIYDKLFNDDIVTDEEREQLIGLYNKLRSLQYNNNYSKDNEVFEEKVNNEAYFEALKFKNTNIKGTSQENQWNRLFNEINEEGDVVPNRFMFNYKVPKDEYIDKEKTEARQYIEDNVDFVTTEYYEKASREASEKGIEEFNKWFYANHIFNPFTHKFQPLKIWTTIQPKPGSALAQSIVFNATDNNKESFVKREYRNTPDKYSDFRYNYKRGDGKYDNGLKLNDKEAALKKHIEDTLAKHATTTRGKKFIGKGYLPRERQANIDALWVGKQTLSLFGLSASSGKDSDAFKREIDYINDIEGDMNMLALAKTKGIKKYKPYPAKTGDPAKDIENYNRVKKENEEIRKHNEALDKAAINKDWRKVMEHFIHNATIFNSRQNAKPYLYLLIEDLYNNKAYRLHGLWDKKLTQNKRDAIGDNPKYMTEDQTNTRELVQNLTRRLIYEQYHENNALRTIANFLQNMTSAKYMIFNVYGGVANLDVGWTGIVAERFAGKYFSGKDLRQAMSDYTVNSPGFIASMYSENSPTKIVGLVKHFDVVNVDDILQFGEGSKGLDQNIRRFRNLLYGFQTGGEHIMQNTVLLSMTKSNRLYKKPNGDYTIGDFRDFTRDIEIEAMKDVVKDNETLNAQYKAYLATLRFDTATKLDLDQQKTSINQVFLQRLGNIDNKVRRQISDLYIKRRNELLKKQEELFAKAPTVEELYNFDGKKVYLKSKYIAEVNNNKHNLESLCAEFKNKVFLVNQKIHGVYDKKGAAQIEKKWFGSLLMQYHKHLWTGVMKRFRRRGYYSEFRGEEERGYYQNLFDLLTTDFINFNNKYEAKKENGENIVLASIKTAIECTINSVMNISLNYKELAPWQQENIKRNFADAIAALTACLIVGALYGIYDDDEIKDDKFKSSMLYLADRLYCDSTMYTPFGLMTEAKTFWSSPIAAANGPADALKAAQLISQYLFDPDFNPTYTTGQYKGQDKLLVLAKRNIPGVRPYQRIMNISNNNKYYKIGNTNLGIKIAKNFGEIINE